MALTIKGGAEIAKRLAAATEKLREAAGRKAARKAMNVVRDAARRAAKEFDDEKSPAAIWRNVYVQQSRSQSRAVGGVVMRVGILGGARTGGKSETASGYPGGDTRHWRHVELGTEDTRAQPFLRPALEQNAQEVLTTLADALRAEVAKL